MTMQPIAPTTPGILTRVPRRDPAATRAVPKSTRFVTESHTLSAPITSPGALFVAAAVAVALYLIGRRLSG